MSNLVLELKPGEMMVINGASIRFRTKSRLELTSRARFLFGKQLMLAAEATTPARRIYFALQTAYIGEDAERTAAIAAAEREIGLFMAGANSPGVRQILEQAMAAAREDRCYAALKLARRIVRHEETMPRSNDNEPPLVGLEGDEVNASGARVC